MNDQHPFTPLALPKLVTLAPPIATKEAHESRSERYHFVPTTEAIEALQDFDWHPVDAQCKFDDPHAAHVVIFEQKERLPLQPRLLLWNAHDGSSSLKILGGMFRFVCANGLVVGDTLHKFKVRHRGDFDLETMLAEAMDVVDEAMDFVGKMRRRELSGEELSVFGKKSGKAVFGDKTTETLNSALVAHTRRIEDVGRDLWRTFNRVQENALVGGIDRGESESGRKSTTRGIRDLERRIAVNRALWDVAMSHLERTK